MPASAYVLEEIARKLQEAYPLLVDKMQGEYERQLEAALKELENIIKKYPQDEEMKSYLKSLKLFYEKKNDKKKLSELVSELNNIVHWRKVAAAESRRLPFKDFRSLRSESGQR